jgi:hypothetical protein
MVGILFQDRVVAGWRHSGALSRGNRRIDGDLIANPEIRSLLAQRDVN